MDITINYIVLVIAATLGYIVSSAWYSRLFLGKIWAKLAGVKLAHFQPDSYKNRIILFGVHLVTAYILYYFASMSHFTHNNAWLGDTMIVSFWLWIGATLTSHIMTNTIENKPSRLTIVQAGYHLVSILTIGLVIGVAGG